MGGWNHRILATEYSNGLGHTELYFQIHEVYYDDQGLPYTHTINPIPVAAESMEELNWVLGEMQKATQKPILWAGEKFPQEYKS
jgi:hypothetical protein